MEILSFFMSLTETGGVAWDNNNPSVFSSSPLNKAPLNYFKRETKHIKNALIIKGWFKKEESYHQKESI